VDTAVQILQTLQGLGVTVSVVDGGRLRFEPGDRIPADLIPTLRQAKPALLEELRRFPASCSSSCYEIEPGRWIHHPWDGCETSVSARQSTVVPGVNCKHCNGAGECSCPACTLRRIEAAVPCLMCQPRKRQAWLAASRPDKRQSAPVPL
jgi:hypothetical protein